MWKLESEEDFFLIYDSKKLVAGYFDPDYGDIFSKKHSEEIIASMLKVHAKVSGGIIMVPLVKFCLFDVDLDTTLNNVEQQVTRVKEHLQKWKNFVSETNCQAHSVRISHTNQDMLTITFPVKFSKPTPLEKHSLSEELSPTMDVLQKSGLL